MSVDAQIPPERDWVALEENDKGVGYAKYDTCDHDDADEPDMYGLYGNPEKKQPNGNFKDRCAACVKDLAKEPPSQSNFGIFIGDFGSMLATPVSYASKLASQVGCEEQ